MMQAEGANSTITQPRRRWPLLLVGSGFVLLVVVGLYYGFWIYSSSQLEGLNASLKGPVTLPELPSGTPLIHGAIMPDGTFKPIQTVVNDVQNFAGSRGVMPGSAEEAVTPEPHVINPIKKVYPNQADSTAAAVETSAADADFVDVGDLVSSYNSIYPGYLIHPKDWVDAMWSGPQDYSFGEIVRPDGYAALSPDDGLPRGQGMPASRITIPAISVDSAVEDLTIMNLGDSLAYDTPNNVVGRIPETSNPGESGNGWFFGHLESPIRGEGNVFTRLPDIPVMLQDGDPVYISVSSDEAEYLYQVTATQVVHQDDLRLYQTDTATITLVTCFPRLIYDHRILVTGELVGVKRG